MREDARQARTGALCQIDEHFVGRAVAVAEEGKAGRQALRLDPVRAQVGLQGVVEQHQAGEVKALEERERNDGIARVGHPGLGVHRVQQRAQGRLLAGRDGCDHQEVVLRRHAQNFRQKSMSRSLPQYTLPR